MDRWLFGSPIRFGEAIHKKKEGDKGVILCGLHQFSILSLHKARFFRFVFSAFVKKTKETLAST